ncbi:MAG: glucosamine-6-phosphate isomerase, partial [Tangfeifania sp.]
MKLNFTKAEEAFFNESKLKNITTRLPYIAVDSFPKLGLLSAISFLEWASENPDGVVSLPTGKTAQYFLQFTHLLLENWGNKKGKDILEKYSLKNLKKPELKNLQFVQMGEFYPIDSEQHNSLYNFVQKNYIEGFGLDPKKALLIDSNSIQLADNKTYSEVFPDFEIDLSLRYREAKSDLERLQQESIFKIDQWCTSYEN